MPVAGARRRGRAARMQHAEIRGERRIGRILHRDFDDAALAGALALVERGHDRAVEMDAGHEIADRRAGLDRRLIRKAGRIDDAAHRLHHQIHRRIVAIRTVLPVARARPVDQPRIDLVQVGGTEPETVHDARREVLDEDVGARHHLAQQFAALFGLEIERHRLLVGVEHRERQGGAAHVAAAAQMLAAERLDLDHVRARHRHQKRRVGPVVDVREVDDRDARQAGNVVTATSRLRSDLVADMVPPEFMIRIVGDPQLARSALRPPGSRENALRGTQMRAIEHAPADADRSRARLLGERVRRSRPLRAMRRRWA